MMSKTLIQLIMCILMLNGVLAITPSQIDGQLFDTDNTTPIIGATINAYLDLNNNQYPDESIYTSTAALNLSGIEHDGYFRITILPEDFTIGETDVILVVETGNKSEVIYIENIKEGTTFGNDIFLREESLENILGVCGNSIIEGGEACDGTNFGGKTCLNYDHDSGSLSCTNQCTISTTNCFNKISSTSDTTQVYSSLVTSENQTNTTNENGGDTTQEEGKSLNSEIICNPQWECNEWGECIAETKTRTCTDINNCGDIQGKPIEQEQCEFIIMTEEEPALITGRVFGVPLNAPNIFISIFVIMLVGGIGYYAYWFVNKS